MMTNLMTILERKAFISSNPRIVLSSCPPPCGHFSIQESATGGLSYKVKKVQNKPNVCSVLFPYTTLRSIITPSKFCIQFHGSYEPDGQVYALAYKIHHGIRFWPEAFHPALSTVQHYRRFHCESFRQNPRAL